MNIEEKAKAYDEAIKRGLDYIRQTPATEMVTRQDVFEAIFPEYTESEDERIRKEISNLYSDIDGCITELLKARTNKDSEAEGKALFKMEGIMVGTLQDLSCIEDYLEKQKEQKPAEWNEKDKEIRNLIIESLDDDSHYFPFKETKKKMIDWLKSLPERFVLQPKQEWSEEDEEMYARVVRRYTDYEGVIMRTKEESVANKMLDAMAQEEIWLKSLRPSWKPSEEQMRFLLAVINEPNNAGSESCHLVLKSIYDDLKKLM